MNLKDQSAIRKEILALRRSLPIATRQQLSHEVTGRLNLSLDVSRLKSKVRIATYQSLSDEMSLDELNQTWAKAGIDLFFPRVKQDPEKELEPVLEWIKMPAESVLDSRSSSWVKGSLGAFEPSARFKAEVTPQFDLILVPGVAFSRVGERIGRGKGFYDRCLTQWPLALRLSLAYEFQMVSSLPQNAWDQAIHWVVTEKSEVRTEFLEKWFEIWLKS